MIVAYQGEPGAFSEQAVWALLGRDTSTLPHPTFAAAAASVLDGSAGAALLPVENTLAGRIPATLALTSAPEFRVAAEISQPIRLYLIGTGDAWPWHIRQVESHPVALAQCGRFLARHPEWKVEAGEDTAGSVRRVIARADPAHAAIAGKPAAERWGGRILAGPVEDHPHNFTRFVLLLAATSEPRRVEARS